MESLTSLPERPLPSTSSQPTGLFFSPPRHRAPPLRAGCQRVNWTRNRPDLCPVASSRANGSICGQSMESRSASSLGFVIL